MAVNSVGRWAALSADLMELGTVALWVASSVAATAVPKAASRVVLSVAPTEKMLVGKWVVRRAGRLVDCWAGCWAVWLAVRSEMLRVGSKVACLA